MFFKTTAATRLVRPAAVDRPIHDSRFDAPYGNKCRRGAFISGRLPAPGCAEAAGSPFKCETVFSHSAQAASRSLYTHFNRVRQRLPALTLRGGDARQPMLIRWSNERQLDREQKKCKKPKAKKEKFHVYPFFNPKL